MKISNNVIILGLVSAFLPSMVQAQDNDILGNFFESQDRKRAQVPFEKQHRNTRREFAPVVEEARKSTVRIYQGEHIPALGTVVAPEGLIVTKASLIKDMKDILVGLPDNVQKPAELVRVDEENDLALLWVHAYGLTPVNWAPGRDLEVGSFVSASGTMDMPLAVGTVSLKLRNLAEGRKGFLGVQMNAVPDREGLVVVRIIEGSGAERADIERGDLILSIDDKPMRTEHDLINTISQSEPGDTVSVELERRGDKQLVEVILGDRETGIPFIPMHEMLDKTARMGGRLSDSHHRSGYPAAIQHDLILKPDQCGGPLVDLDGRVVGINIARASRVKSYAIPSEVIQEWLGDPNHLAEEVISGRIKNAEAAREAAEKVLEEAKQAEEVVRQAMTELKERQEAKAAADVAARLKAEIAAKEAEAELGDVDAEINDPENR